MTRDGRPTCGYCGATEAEKHRSDCSRAAHDVYQHREDGRTCALDERGVWWVPYDVGGEGPECDRAHGPLPQPAPAPTQAERQCADVGQIEAVLAAHEYQNGPKPGQCCSCGFVLTIDRDSLDPVQVYHRAHVAAQVAAIADGGLAGKVLGVLDGLTARADYVVSECCKDHGLIDSVDRMLSDSPDVRDRLGYADGIKSAVATLRALLASGEETT